MDRKLKIALISTFPPSAQSLNEYGYHLAINFAKFDQIAELIIIADQIEGDYQEWDLDDKIRVKRVWKFNNFFTPFTILKALKKEKIDLAIYNVQLASFGDKEIPAAIGLLSPFFTRIFGVKSGVIAHNLISGIDLDDTLLKGQAIRQNFVRLGASIIDYFLFKANYVTVTLQSYYEQYSKRFPNANLYFVPHGSFEVPDGEITPPQKRKNRIITMGKFGTYKRLETLIEAFDIVKKKLNIPDLELVIGGGDHPNKKGYMKSVEKKYAHIEALTFRGYIAEEEVADFFQSAKLCVFDYSSTTGSSGVLHQAVIYGTFPIFPFIGDFVDVANAEGIHGANYEANDVNSMAEAIEKALSDENWIEKICASNSQAAAAHPMSEICQFHLDHL